MKRSTSVKIALATATAAGLTVSALPAYAASPASSFTYKVTPIAVKSHFGKTPAALPAGPADCLAQTAGEFACQTPHSIRAAYDIPDTINGKAAGTGQTIVIVDAFGSPTAASDLATFSTAFGLPQADLSIYYPGGKPTYNGHDTQPSWAQETSLDIQWAHAVAPGAKIALVVAANDHGASLDNAVKYAVDNKLGNVLSMSYGESENLIHGNNAQQSQVHKTFAKAAAQGMSVFASSADSGSDNGAGYENFSLPAADPLVTAVGGTNLYAGSGLAQPRETVWGDYANCPTNCADGPFGATGGAPSLLTAKQGSDVAYNASVYTGVLTYLGMLGGDNNGFYFFGGTSAGSPQWAGIAADLDQATGSKIGSVSNYARSWARSGMLYDVTEGSNSTPTFSGGYSASTGWDSPTGWGTPNVGAIIDSLTK
ncbi:S53 family peptidase [Flexivirga sp.]|uniref:S53 family peptidase n=1 Tax=Flexivirga sp. TaxID=1962927 RepID=UPI003F7DCD11